MFQLRLQLSLHSIDWNCAFCGERGMSDLTLAMSHRVFFVV